MGVLRAEKETMLFLAAPACCLPAQGSVLGTGGSLKVPPRAASLMQSGEEVARQDQSQAAA